MEILRHDFYPEQLIPLLQQSGISGTVAVQADQSLTETAFLLDLAKKNSIIRGVVGWIDLQSSSLNEQLDQFEGQTLLKGFRHIVQGESDAEFMLRPAFLRGVQFITQKNYSYDILIRDHQLPMAFRFSEQLPQAKLVINHLAKPRIKSGDWKQWASDIRKFASLENVYCKVSGLVTEADPNHLQIEYFRIYLDVVTQVFGPKRLMYGSDWPVCLLASGYHQQLQLAFEYFNQFSETEKSAVFRENAQHFYNL